MCIRALRLYLNVCASAAKTENTDIDSDYQPVSSQHDFILILF